MHFRIEFLPENEENLRKKSKKRARDILSSGSVKNHFYNCFDQECAFANSFMYSTSAQTPSFGMAL